ncbi:MAG: hypothetical protein ACRD12_00745 [Acidimicrobiales bacterium]
MANVDQSGLADHHLGPTKASDPRLREALSAPPNWPARSNPSAPRHTTASSSATVGDTTSAVCTLAAVLVTRNAAC